METPKGLTHTFRVRWRIDLSAALPELTARRRPWQARRQVSEEVSADVNPQPVSVPPGQGQKPVHVTEEVKVDLVDGRFSTGQHESAGAVLPKREAVGPRGDGSDRIHRRCSDDR